MKGTPPISSFARRNSIKLVAISGINCPKTNSPSPSMNRAGAPAVVQQDWWYLGSTGMWVPSPPWHSGLRSGVATVVAWVSLSFFFFLFFSVLFFLFAFSGSSVVPSAGG